MTNHNPPTLKDVKEQFANDFEFDRFVEQFTAEVRAAAFREAVNTVDELAGARYSTENEGRAQFVALQNAADQLRTLAEFEDTNVERA